jgi:hypothetical protein
MSDDATMLVKLAVFDAERRVLAESDGALARLPEVEIRRFTRVAYAATHAAQEKYGLSLFVLLGAKARIDDEAPLEKEGLVLVCRTQNPGVPVRGGLAWMAARAFAGRASDLDRATLEAARAEFELYDSGAKPSSFGRYRALDDLRDWYAPHLAALGVRETGIQQWNGDPWFALFRISVEPVDEAKLETPKALWFKAVGEPNTREFAVTLALTQECPYWFAKLVAAKPEWDGWLMEEADGHELDDEADGRPWALTARILAKVQKRFVGQENRLLALGCCDWRVPRVLDCLDLFFDRMEPIMRRQKSALPQVLDASELRVLKGQCRALCHNVEDLDIPDTIAHGDFSPHNVIVSNGWPVLIDWAEAYVSFPFISWEYFWNRTVKDHPDYQTWHERMHRNYAYRVWEPLLGRRRVDEGMRLAPAMAVLVHALYGLDLSGWGESDDAAKVKRSLARRLQRELQVVEPAGVL